MAIAERQLKERHEQELAGLDALETVVEHEPSLGSRAWASLWPKLLAIAIVLGGWQLLVMSGWKSRVHPPVAVHRPRAAVDRHGHVGVLARHQRDDATSREGIRPRPRHRRNARPGGVALPGAARRCGLPDHRLADHAVRGLVPAGDPALQADRRRHHVRDRAGRRAVHRQRAHPWRGPRAADHAPRRPGAGRQGLLVLPPRHPSGRVCRPSRPASSRGGPSPGGA